MNNPELVEQTLTEFLHSLQEIIPNHAQSLLTGIDLLAQELESAKKAINSIMADTNDRGDYEEAGRLLELAKALKSYEEIVKNFLNANHFESTGINKGEKQPGRTERVNYDNYRVDDSIPYDLNDNTISLTSKRPAAFCYRAHKYQVRTWKDLLVKVCELLYSEDRVKFAALAEDKALQGRKRQFLSRQAGKTRIHIAGSGYYVETNLSAEAIKGKILYMLNQYGIEGRTITYYIRKDLSSLHNEAGNA